jgi:hypothetical protein
MASLQGTTFVGTTEVLASEVYVSGSGMTPWKTIFMCPGGEGNNQAWIHIRTPLPATNASSGSGWNPSIVEVKGYHSYSASYGYDFQAVINSAGDGSNAWYGSQIRINRGNTGGTQNPSGTLPVIYKSTSPYNSYERVCIALPRTTCCCNGWSWVRWWNNTGILDTVAWATVGSTSSANAY